MRRSQCGISTVCVNRVDADDLIIEGNVSCELGSVRSIGSGKDFECCEISSVGADKAAYA